MRTLRGGRRGRLAAAATGFALALTACGGDGGGSGSGGGGGDSEEPFLIGYYGPGAIAQGQDIRDAVQLAVQQVNAEGEPGVGGPGIGGRPVELTSFCDTETGARPDLAQACVQGFIQEQRVDAIIGGFSSGEVLATLDTVVAGETIYISTGAAASAITEGVTDESERRWIFRQGPVKDTALAADMCLTYAGKLFPTLGVDKVGILFEDVAFNEALIPALQECLTDPQGSALGQSLNLPEAVPPVEVVTVQEHLPDATSFASQFAALENAGAQFVIVSNSRQEGVTLVQQWAATQPSFGLAGINVAGQTPGFLQAAGGGDARYFMDGPAGAIRAELGDRTIEFFNAFQEEYGREAIYTGPPAYDAVFALDRAAALANSTNNEELVQALADVEFSGAQGPTAYDDQHDIVYGAGGQREGINPLYYQWEESGDKRLVFPETLPGSEEYLPPPWVDFPGGSGPAITAESGSGGSSPSPTGSASPSGSASASPSG